MKTPADVLLRFEQAAKGLVFGEASLTVSVKEGRQRFIIDRRESFLPGLEPSVSDELVKEDEHDSQR